MKLKNIDFLLKWSNDVKLDNLREFIKSNISQKGEIVRWSIIDIKNSKNSHSDKILRISAVIII